MFTVSYPELVIAQCLSGVVGSFPALNARESSMLPDWIAQINQARETAQIAHPTTKIGPFAVNQIMHPSNQRITDDIRLCVDAKVPLFITSLQAPNHEMIQAVHAYGGLIFHDVINMRHAEKAIVAGVDGLVLVCTGAGGHTGHLSPFAFMHAIRPQFDGLIALSGSISSGQDILAAQILGADFAYMGTRFIATEEAHAAKAYKDAIIQAQAKDIVLSNYFTGVLGSYLRQSIIHCQLDPDHLPVGDKANLDFKARKEGKAWKDIWGAGQGVGYITDSPSVSSLINALVEEYQIARNRLNEII
jgi:nitronate monooxygenase